MYLTIVDETGSCRLLIMLNDAGTDRPKSKFLADESQRGTDPLLLHEIFQTLLYIYICKIMKNLPAGSTPETHNTHTGQSQ